MTTRNYRGLLAILAAATITAVAWPSTISAQAQNASFNTRTRNFNNQTVITIHDSCPDPELPECAGLPDYYFENNTLAPYIPAQPYPSQITVPPAAFVEGAKITDVNVTIKNLTHACLDDVEILLVGPGGQYSVLASDVSSGELTVTNVNWKFDDSAALPLPNTNSNTGRASRNQNNALFNLIYPAWVDVWLAPEQRTFKPSDYDIAVADDAEQYPQLPQANNTPQTVVSYPAGPYDTTAPFENPPPTVTGGSPLSVFNGLSPVGTWKLYVNDDLFWFDGSLGGWGLEITAAR